MTRRPLPSRERGAAAAVAVASASALLFELVETRILSFIFWNHVVYLTVSLAMLGFAVAGTLLALRDGPRDDRRLLGRLWLGLGGSLLASLVLSSRLLPAVLGAGAALKLGACYLAVLLPFVFSGAILSLWLGASGPRVHAVYAVDLLASGAGCALFPLLLPLLGAPLLVLLLSIAALSMALLQGEPRDWSRRVAGPAAALAAALAVLQCGRPSLFEFVPEPGKELGRLLGAGGPGHARIEATSWTPLARIDVVGDEKERLLGYGHPVGSYKIVTQDGTAHTPLLSRAALERLAAAERSGKGQEPTTLAYELLKEPEVAIIGVGGGTDVANALIHGAKSVLGIELNPFTFRLVTETYAGYQGRIMDDSRVRLINAEGRSALRSLDRTFDAIQVIAIDTFAALDAGAYVLSENYLYTVEAFEDYFRHLRPGGLLSFYRWLQKPPRETLRLSLLACEAWRRLGIRDADRRIMVFGRGDWALSLFKNGPFSEDEVRRLAERAYRNGQIVLFWPKLLGSDEQRAYEARYYAQAGADWREIHEAFDRGIRSYAEGTEKDFLDAYPYRVDPPTDESPFFFEYERLLRPDVPALEVTELRSRAVGASLLLVLAESALVGAAAVLWPLWTKRRAALSMPWAPRFALFFASLGFGFMVVEIALVQKSVLILDGPLYALALVTAALLVSAGIGSRAFGESWSLRRVGTFLGPILAALLLLAIPALSAAYRALLPLPLASRCALAALLLSPLGFLMGAFFPAGLRSVSAISSAFVPWAWGINGCAAVFGSIAAILVAMASGFDWTLALGAVCYAAASGAAAFGGP